MGDYNLVFFPIAAERWRCERFISYNNIRFSHLLAVIENIDSKLLYDLQSISTRAKTISERIRFCETHASFEITTLFPHLYGKGKRAAISKLACVSQKRIRSDIVLALGLCTLWYTGTVDSVEAVSWLMRLLRLSYTMTFTNRPKTLLKRAHCAATACMRRACERAHWSRLHFCH